MKDTSKLCKVKLIIKYWFKILDSDKIVINPHSELKILHKQLQIIALFHEIKTLRDINTSNTVKD